MANPEPFQVVIMGVSGSGKTTLAALLSERLGCAFAEADQFHSAENIAKMSAGEALGDEDRWPWLRRLAAWMVEQARAGRPAIITCSALKRSYRELLRSDAPRAVFVHLAGSRELIAGRLDRRQGHFMPPSLLDSQLATLEALGPDEPGAAFDASRSPEALASAVQAYLLEREP